MPDARRAAWAELRDQASRLGVHGLSELLPQDDGRDALILDVEVANERLQARLLVPVAFPYGEIEVFAVSPAWQRYAHQNVTGKLCVRPDAVSTRGSSRLVEAVEAMMEWLLAAHQDTLTEPGERYELPDFPLQRHDWRLLFDEAAADHARWGTRIGTSGEAVLGRQIGGWAVERFSAAEAIIAERVSIRPPLDEVRASGAWIVVDAFAADGHRAARTWEELRAIFPPLDAVLFKAWCAATSNTAVVLVGAPMRSTWVGSPTRMHWQPIVFESHKAACARTRGQLKVVGDASRRKHLRPAKMWRAHGPIAGDPHVPWAPTEDVSRMRLYARSTGARRGFAAPVLIGCGAIGSIVADCLVRGGLASIALVDRESLEYGNLCRHTLGGASVGTCKAFALAAHLQLASPSVKTLAVPATLPPLTKGDATSFEAVLRTSDLIIDASGDEEVLEWLSNVDHGKRIASVWTNADASIGVGVLSGADATPTVAAMRVHVRDTIHAAGVPDVSADVYRGPALVVPGAGCWHPTFLGSWSRIVGLGAALVEWLNTAAGRGRDGRAVVFRFHDGAWQRARAWNLPAGSV